MLTRLLAVLGALALLLPLPVVAQDPPPPGEPAVLIDNVDGVAIQDGRQVRFTGLVIDKAGRVVARLAPNAARPKNVATVDGKGATMLPGLMDAHVHVMGLGTQLMQLDLSDTRSLEEAKAKIRAYAASRSGTGWIVGRGWNQETWRLGRFPTAADLDDAVNDVPVYLERVDGHAGWANTAALTAAGITSATRSPDGGRIEMANGKPSGILVDKATALVTNRLPPIIPIDQERALLKAQEELLSRGITAVADMGTSPADWLVMRRIGDAGNLLIRVVSYAAGLPAALEVAGTGPTPWLYGDRLRMVGVKLYADGALGSRGAWLKVPYADAEGQTGLPFLTDGELRNQMSRAAMDRFQLAIHAIGDRGNEQVLGAIEELSDTYKGDQRWRIEHAQVVDPADMARFGRNGIVASMQPTHQTSDRTMAEARLSQDRLAGAYAWASMLKAGARLALGSDTPVEKPDVFAGLAAAITRQDAAGQPAGGWLPEERLTREQALAGFTEGAAYAAFADDRFGSLAPGQWADFVLVDTDPTRARPDAIRGTQVRETWIAGKPVWPFSK